MGEWSAISDTYEAECHSDYEADPNQALLLILTPLEHQDQFIERRIPFDAGTVVSVGRASSTESKQLFEAPENGYIVCPVISRDHAKIECRFDQKLMKLFIRDLSSSHGTKVNDAKLVGEHPLRSGDTLEFGTVISRGDETFYPPKYLVDIELRNRDTKQSEVSGAPKTANSGFAVPESDESDEASEVYSDEEEEDQEEGKAEKSSPTYMSFSVQETTAKATELENGISSESTHDTSPAREYPSGRELKARHPSWSESAMPSVEPPDIASSRLKNDNSDSANLGPISSRGDGDLTMFYPGEDDFGSVIPETLEDPFPSTVEEPATSIIEALSNKPSASLPRDFECDTDVESEAMSDTRYSDLDAESDYDFDAAISPMITRVSAESTMLPSTTWGPPPSHETTRLFQQYQPASLPISSNRINNYQSGPFALSYQKVHDADMKTELFGHTATVAGAESELTRYNAPDPLLLNGPLHLTSSTTDQTEALRTRRLVHYETFGQPLAKSPLMKSMSIDHIINAENTVSKKRKLDDEDDAAVHGVEVVIPIQKDAEDVDNAEHPETTTVAVIESAKDHVEARGTGVKDVASAGAGFAANATASTTTPAVEPVIEQPAQKKRKTNSVRSFFTGTAFGALVGGIGVFAGLASLSESFMD